MQSTRTDTGAPAILMAGIPQTNLALYHRIRFSVGDPVAYLQLPTADGGRESILILRDIEMERARKHARADRVACPADFAPEGGLSGDRETATAQAAVECLRRADISLVIGDRTLPLIFAEFARQAGIGVQCDPTLGVVDRRCKDDGEIDALRESQRITEEIMALACQRIARAEARRDGVLLHEGGPLTSQKVRAFIDHWLIDRGFVNPPSIVAGGRVGADCHDLGHGELRTGESVIVDIFPRNSTSHYYGDCTRTVVHGDIPDEIARMHKAVCDAKRAGIAAARAGVTGESVHLATIETIRKHGYSVGLPAENSPETYCAMTHGTGHGVGLDVHEPPLLDRNGPVLLAGDVVTIEPGLYCRNLGGVRVEDMVVIRDGAAENLNRLPESLDWK